MNTRIRKIRWERVAILLMVPLLIFFAAGVLVGSSFKEVKPVVVSQPVPHYCVEVVVKKGDTVWSLLEAQGFSKAECLHYLKVVDEINNLRGKDLWEGRKLLIPVKIR